MSAESLTFLGAARTVTGSKYLLQLGERRILIDAGMFQGEKQWRLRNWEDFPVPPDTLTDIVLTHAHMDHCGYLPALVKNGFDGPVWCTAGTAALAAIVLRDSGFLAEREARDAAAGGWSKHTPPLPIYTSADVERTLPLLHPVDFDTRVDLGEGVGVVFTRAGHVLGSASVTVRTPHTSIVFSGDLGRHDHPVLRPRDKPPGADYVVMESTYGDREHPEPANLAHEALADAIRRTAARAGSVLIPAFAIDRTEVVLRTLAQLRADGRIPAYLPIYVNSPMATAALEVYRRATAELRPDIDIGEFTRMDNVHLVASAEESMALTAGRHRDPCIVISSSGMVNGGRVLHHLERMLPDARNTIVLTGYQAVGTRGRALMEGATQLKMHGKYLPVRAEIVADQEFSVHGDASDLIDWVRELDPQPITVFVTHGEEKAAEQFAKRLQRELELTAVVPAYGERVALDARAPDAGVVASPRASAVTNAQALVEAHASAVGATTSSAVAALDRQLPRVDGLDGARIESDLTVHADTPETITLTGTITIRLRGDG
ncbi:MAG: MBL fold metallo-hydrolase [Dermatophilaceae bacterium]